MSKTMIQHIRSLPVVGVVRLSFIAAFDISSRVRRCLRTGIEAASSITFGPQFDRGAWSCVAKRDADVRPACHLL